MPKQTVLFDSVLGQQHAEYRIKLINEAEVGNHDSAREVIQVAASGLEDGQRLPSEIRRYLRDCLWRIVMDSEDANIAFRLVPRRGQPPKPDQDDAIAALFHIFLRARQRKGGREGERTRRAQALKDVDQWIFDWGDGSDGMTRAHLRRVVNRLCPHPTLGEFAGATDAELEGVVDAYFDSIPVDK